jgi:DNA-binding helix-hairpin-helix protein with protein kinase domain
MSKDNPIPELIALGIGLYQLGSWTYSKLKNSQNEPVNLSTKKTDIEGKKLSFMVYGPDKSPQKLDVELARGGEGAVYPLASRPEILVKVYHPDKLDKDGQYLEEKIEAMVQLKSQFEHSSLCWPRLSVYDEHHRWIGYAMKRGGGVPMTKLAHAMLYKKHFPHLNRNHVVQYLLNFIDTVDLLHKSNIYIGDFNLNNVLSDPKSDAITLIDCDSYQLTMKGKSFPCLVGSPDLTPIEHHGRDFRQIVRTAESDAFSLAIILFKCLMLGRHPYDIVGGEDPVSNMRTGGFPYGKGTRGLPRGHWYNIWSHMPYRLKEMFIKTFTEGAGNPTARPTLSEWKEVLTIYQKEIKKGFHAQEIIPSEPKKSERR